MSDHTIMIIWAMKIFLYSSSVYFCHLFLISSVSVRSIHRDRGSGHSRLGYGISPLGGGHHSPHHRAAELIQDWEIDSWRAQTAFCTRTQEKEAVTPQETDSDLPVCVQESLAEAWLAVACCRVGGTECSSACVGPFEGGRHYLHNLHHSLAPGK